MYPQWGSREGTRNINGNAPESQYTIGHPSAQYASDVTHVHIQSSVRVANQMLQYPSQYIDASHWNQDRGQQQFYMVPQGLSLQGHVYSTVINGEAAAYEDGHRGAQPPFNVSDGYEIAQAPLSEHILQREAMGPACATAPPVIRRVATAAVIDAAEKRRVNPHRFFCHHCDRGFTATHNYKRHLRAHYGQRPFPCYCGSAFTTSSDLKRHQSKSKKHGKEH